jgi:hypothetical protein
MTIAEDAGGVEPEIEFLAKLVDLFESTPMDDAMCGRAMRYLVDRYMPRDGSWAYATIPAGAE